MRSLDRLMGTLVVSAGLSIWAAGTASAYSCITTSCSGHCQNPVTYKLGTPSADLGLQGTESELKKGMESWTVPSCSSLKVQYGGTTTEAPSNANGVVAWAESKWGSGSGTIGVTTSRLSSKCIASHMHMNGVNFKWVTGNTASGREVNAFTIIAHEGGHYVGLGHSNASGAVMAASYGGGVIPLNADDQAGICKIYPGGGGMSVPGAPPSMGGSGGSSGGGGASGGGSGGNGNGTLCANCTVGTECASGICVRNNSTGERFCGRSCEGGCPSGFTCTAIDNDDSEQCVPDGGSCSGVVVPKEDGAGGGAAGGQSGGGAGGSGNAGPGAPPPGMSSTECGQDADCGSNKRCNGSGKCEPQEEGVLVAPDGEGCEINEDCQSRLCVEHEKGRFCSRVCNTNAECVNGFACRKQGDEKLCLTIEKEEDGRTDAAPVRSNVGCSLSGSSRQGMGGGLMMLSLLAVAVGLGRRWAKRKRLS